VNNLGTASPYGAADGILQIRVARQGRNRPPEASWSEPSPAQPSGDPGETS